MKKLMLMTVAAMLVGSATYADEIFGTWKTIPDDNNIYGLIKVEACGDKICGTLVKSFNASDNTPYASDNIGKKLVWDMVNQGGGNYGGGIVWSPDRDKEYSGKLKLRGNQLTVQGCVFIICRDGGVRSRVN